LFGLQKILELHLQNCNVELICEVTGLAERTVYAKIKEIEQKFKEIAENSESEIEQKYNFLTEKVEYLHDFSPSIYNIWKQLPSEF